MVEGLKPDTLKVDVLQGLPLTTEGADVRGVCKVSQIHTRTDGSVGAAKVNPWRFIGLGWTIV